MQMSRCADEQMSRCADEQMCRCADEQMCRCADEQMSRCADEQMCRLVLTQGYLSTCNLASSLLKLRPRVRGIASFSENL